MTPELALTITGMVGSGLLVFAGFVASDARSKARNEADREKLQGAIGKVAGVENSIVDLGQILGSMRGDFRTSMAKVETKIEHLEHSLEKMEMRNERRDDSGSWPAPPRTKPGG